jgi:hypothetical protein
MFQDRANLLMKMANVVVNRVGLPTLPRLI